MYIIRYRWWATGKSQDWEFAGPFNNEDDAKEFIEWLRQNNYPSWELEPEIAPLRNDLMAEYVWNLVENRKG